MADFGYLSTALGLLAVAVIYDFRSREIPDWISVALMAIACAAATFGWAGVQWWMVVSGAVVGLAIGTTFFYLGNFGGGDAKLIAGLGALLGPVALLIVLFWMAIAGGVLALIAIARCQRDYAYAPAIAAGFIGYILTIQML